MVHQKTYLKLITKCPYCNWKNSDLVTYQIYNPPNQKFIDDFVITNVEKVGFIKGFRNCDKCNKKYFVKIGVKIHD